jgi:hypothetical protein
MSLYRIKLTGLGTTSYWQHRDAWVRGVSCTIPKVGGDGKFWSSKDVAEKNLKSIQKLPGCGKYYTVELITYDLVERVG